MDKERERIRKEIFDKPGGVASEQSNIANGDNPEINPGLLRLFPPKRLARIMEKEARKYKQALKKKWSRWLESMSK